jgi:glycosyltransferase involved in cell wall biosynthesis
VRELALALGREHRELELSFVTTRELPVPAGVLETLSPYGPILHADNRALSAHAIYHLPSPFEPSATDFLWPPERRDSVLMVTLHDLIPAVFPAEQMPDPGVRRAYWARTELVRQADRVLAVSEATAQDAVRLLGVPEGRLTVTGGGVSDDFRPPESHSVALADLRALRPGIGDEFVLYTGGMDYRKNVGGLLQAYAALPQALRERYQLVLVGRLGADDPRGLFGRQAEALGVADRVVFTGFVSDDELVALYQTCSLFVFPSLYEGFGLPVAEALAIGAVVVASDSTSIPEVAGDAAILVDPRDDEAVTAGLVLALTDDDLRARLMAAGPVQASKFTWAACAEATTAAYRIAVG